MEIAGGIDLAELVLAAGALGTAAFGLVDGLKIFPWVGRMGFGWLLGKTGKTLKEALIAAYGGQAEALLAWQYQNGRAEGRLPQTLRQGVRLGLSPDNAASLAAEIGFSEDRAALLAQAVQALPRHGGAGPSDNQQIVISRFEVAMDARLDALLALAEQVYRNGTRLIAAGLAIALALGMAALMTAGFAAEDSDSVLLKSLIVGVAAVPLAPVAKDVAKALGAARTSLAARR